MQPSVTTEEQQPGITRRRAGKGWCYRDPHGRLITDAAERARLNAIALPPAYSHAWFNPDPEGHILATGIDDAGRKQYRYHPDFRLRRESAKYDACAAFGARLPRLRARVHAGLAQPRLNRERAIAAVVRLLDLSAIRIGNAQYASANDSYGATTLRAAHVTLGARRLVLAFTGKGGKNHRLTLADARLARAVQRMADLGGADDRLFRYADDDGAVRCVTSADVNGWLRETMGDDFTAKHFRTFHASAIAFAALAGATGHLRMADLLERVASHLGNTPAIARSSYVHPAVLALVDDQQAWQPQLRLPRATRWLSRHERGLIALLETAGTAAPLLSSG